MEGGCTLPDELIEDIMLRLAVRDLLRCRSVSKEWCALIDSPCFINKHYQFQLSIHMVNGNIPYIVRDSVKLNLLSVQNGDVNPFISVDDLECDSMDMNIWELDKCNGCVNGIVCLKWNNTIDILLGLWNPATREYKVVAPPYLPRSSFGVIGFGCDPISKDLKILARYYHLDKMDKWPPPRTCYVIYSLKTDSWKSLGGPSLAYGRGCTDRYLNGVCYWDSWLQQVDEEQVDEELRLVIVSFSFSSQEFKVSDPPKYACNLNLRHNSFQLMLYKESIALIINHEVEEKCMLYKIDIWVVTHFDDCGVPLSWQHLFSVEPTPILGLRVVTALINGDLILTSWLCNEKCRFPYNCDTEHECCIYKTSSSELKKLGKDIFRDYFRFVESLFPLSKRYLT